MALQPYYPLTIDTSDEHEDYWLLSPPDKMIYQYCEFQNAYHICTSTEITALVGTLVEVALDCIRIAGKQPPGTRELLLLRKDLEDRFPKLRSGLSKHFDLGQYIVGDRAGQVDEDLTRRVDLLSEASFVHAVQETQQLNESGYGGTTSYEQSLLPLGNFSGSSNTDSSFRPSTEDDEMQACTSVTSGTDSCPAEVVHETSTMESSPKGKGCKATCATKLFRCDYCNKEYSKKSELTRHWTQAKKGCPSIPRQPRDSCKSCGTNHDSKINEYQPKVEWLPQNWIRKAPDIAGNEDGLAAYRFFLGSFRATETSEWVMRHFQFGEDPRKRN